MSVYGFEWDIQNELKGVHICQHSLNHIIMQICIIRAFQAIRSQPSGKTNVLSQFSQRSWANQI